MPHDRKSLILTLVIDRIGVVVWFVCLFFVPQLARWYDLYSRKDSIFIQFVVLVYLAMIPAIIILILLDRLLSNICAGKIFEHSNVTFLRIISYCCFAISLISAIMVIWRVLALVIFLAFAFIGLLLRVLKNVFEQAVVLREENDLTV